MIKIQQIDSVNEVISKWPRLLALALKDDPTLKVEYLLTLFLRCLESGVVFFVFGDHGLMGHCCALNEGEFVSLLSLPRDNGVGMAKECLAHVKDYAREVGVDELRVTTLKWCGSNFKYFEKSLGFERHIVVFRLKI